MDTLQAALLAGAIITGQGAIWQPVTVATLNEPEPVVFRSSSGAVTNEYKPKPKAAPTCDKENGLRCWFIAFE